MKKEIFAKLSKLFNDNGYRLFMIGGTTRDYLLGLEVYDYDFTSDATPEEMKKFLTNANFTFAKFGSVRLKIDDIHVDITTLREEGEYLDYRHPSYIKYVKDIKEDYVRRDFTINAIYIDENMKVIDPSGLGIKDLENKLIRFIGNPQKRIEEDPLRIIRAERFAKKLNFKLEPETLKAIENCKHLLSELNPDKIKEEMKKMDK